MWLFIFTLKLIKIIWNFKNLSFVTSASFHVFNNQMEPMATSLDYVQTNISIITESSIRQSCYTCAYTVKIKASFHITHYPFWVCLCIHWYQVISMKMSVHLHRSVHKQYISKYMHSYVCVCMYLMPITWRVYTFYQLNSVTWGSVYMKPFVFV